MNEQSTTFGRGNFVNWLSPLLTLSLLPTIAFAGASILEDNDAPNSEGERLYLSHCHRCHGNDGDAADYYGIVPLAGIGRRPPVGLVGRFQKNSFRSRGVEFRNKAAASLWRYLISLTGNKGFPDTGWLWSPLLLERKYALFKSCRILDVRDAEEYLESHIPNALSVPLESIHSKHSLLGWRAEIFFQENGISENTQVVIYDRRGGPQAAWLWWILIEYGHPYVALLDGGWLNWVAKGLPVSDQIVKVDRTSYPSQEPKTATETEFDLSANKTIEWNWKETLEPGGLRNAESLDKWLGLIGLREPGYYLVEGGPKKLSYLIFLLKLFGRSGHIRDIQNGACILQIDPDGETH